MVHGEPSTLFLCPQTVPPESAKRISSLRLPTFFQAFKKILQTFADFQQVQEEFFETLVC